MANRPWVQPSAIKEYSENNQVQKRSDQRLRVDIARAEKYVITLTHNTFEEYNSIPEDVKTAVIILAEAYANNAIRAAKTAKSETFDDYSYTDKETDISVEGLDIAALLDDYVINEPKNGVNMRLRKL